VNPSSLGSLRHSVAARTIDGGTFLAIHGNSKSPIRKTQEQGDEHNYQEARGSCHEWLLFRKDKVVEGLAVEYSGNDA
jgi:hypothetical protein